MPGVDLNVVDFNIDKSIPETYTSNEELASVAGSITGIGCCCGDQRTVATGKTEWECFWTVILKQGQITVEGPYYDDGTDTTLAITGGTGAYVGAQGQMLLHATGNPVGSEYDFIYTLVN
ncbi:MAG TPA: hypothetical protein VED37_12515 [Ktedonobacteraceae bacterium]|nr:hypothetical protein [Ktedonobacteraceae bacterium]